MSLKNHPNVELHDKLIKAFREGKLDDEFIRDNLSWETKGKDNTAAYINWDCTFTLLLPHPAIEWFAGVSEPKDGSSFFAQSPDEIRDTRSYGTSWSADRTELRATIEDWFFFTIEQTSSEFYAEVCSRNKIVAVFKGTPAVDLEGNIVPAPVQYRRFWGPGYWSMVD